jgi:pilus assembly protein CpaB
VGNRRTLMAAAAIVLALAAGLGVYFYTSGADERAADDVAVVQAFVAVDVIPKGTSADVALSAGLIEPASVLRGSVPPSAVTDTSGLSGRVAASTIAAKQFITEESFLSPAQGGGGSLAAAIGGKDLVAVTVAVDAPRAVANQIAPGDRVDMLVGGGSGGPTTYLLENVRVLAVGARTASTDTSDQAAAAAAGTDVGLITFEVSRADALVIVANADSVYLTLRPLAGAAQADRTVPAAGG